MIDIDPLLVDAEGGEAGSLGCQVLIGGGDSRVADQELGHEPISQQAGGERADVGVAGTGLVDDRGSWDRAYPGAQVRGHQLHTSGSAGDGGVLCPHLQQPMPGCDRAVGRQQGGRRERTT